MSSSSESDGCLEGLAFGVSVVHGGEVGSGVIGRELLLSGNDLSGGVKGGFSGLGGGRWIGGDFDGTDGGNKSDEGEFHFDKIYLLFIYSGLI